MNTLYVTMSAREKRLGWLWFGCFVLILTPLAIVWPGAVAVFAKAALSFAAAVLIFRDFLRDSFRVPLTTTGQILLKALLGLIVSSVATIAMNDLFYFYLPEYFAYTDFGPMYYNVNEAAFAALTAEHFWPMTLAFVVLMPIGEELLFRGLLFGSLYRRSRWLAHLVSVALFAFLPTLGLIGNYPTLYIVMNFLQYVPLGLVLGWMYTSTETIVTPIVLRMVLHAVAICSMR